MQTFVCIVKQAGAAHFFPAAPPTHALVGAGFAQSNLSGGKVWVAPFNKKEIAVWQQCYTGQRHYCRAHPGIEQYWKRHGLWQAAAFREWLLRQEDQARLQATARYCLKVKLGDILIAVEPHKRLLALGLISSDPESPPIPTYGASRYVPWIKTGNKRLEEIGFTIMTNLRSGDAAARFGGDEFPAFLLDAKLAQGLVAAERIRSTIEDYPFSIVRQGKSKETHHITVSIGVSSFPTDSSDPIELVEMADSALYRAKHDGRNSVAVYSELPAHSAEIILPSRRA